MPATQFYDYKSEATCWLEEFFSRFSDSRLANYNFFEGLHCGMICGQGGMSYAFDETSPPHESTVELFEDFGADLDNEKMRTFQSALLTSAKSMNMLATDIGFYFAPYWYGAIAEEIDINNFYEKALRVGKNLDGILKRIYPNMFAMDHDPKHLVDVSVWAEGFLQGLIITDAVDQLQEDLELKQNLDILNSLKDNCYYTSYGSRPQPTKSTLKLIDFYMFAYQVPVIILTFYAAIQLNGLSMKQSPSPRMRNTSIDKKRHGKKRNQRR
jgi:hypothetical protein